MNDETKKRVINLLQKMEWRGCYGLSTGLTTCPICETIPDYKSYNKVGKHHPDCELNNIIKELEMLTIF